MAIRSNATTEPGKRRSRRLLWLLPGVAALVCAVLLMQKWLLPKIKK